MLKEKKRLLMVVADSLLTIAAYVLVVIINNNFFIGTTIDVNNIGFNLIGLLPFYLLSQYIILAIYRVYPSIWRRVSVKDIVLLAGGLITNMLMVCFGLILFNRLSLVSFVIYTSVLSFLFMSAVRIAYRVYCQTSLFANEHELVNSLIIGAGQGGDLLYRELTSNPVHKAKVIGFVDDNLGKKGFYIHGSKVLGTTDDLQAIKNKYGIKRVYIAIPSLNSKKKAEIIEKSLNAKFEVKQLNFSENKKSVDDVEVVDLLGREPITLDKTKIGSYIKNQVVLVTGAGGSIGSELCRQIINYEPKKLIMLDIYENNLYDLQQELKHNNVDQSYLIASVRDKGSLEEIFRQNNINIVYHAAAHKHVPLMEDMPKESIKNNVYGTYNVVKTAVEFKVDRFVLVSTDKAVNPTNVMGATKRMAELVVQSFKGGHTKIGAVRFGNVLGSNGSVIPLFKKQIKNGGPITITDPKIIRYFMLIPEAVSLVLQAGGYASDGEIFVLDMGEPVKIVDLAKNLIKLSNLELDKDISIEYTGLRPGEKMYEELILDKESNEKTANDLIYIAHPVGLTQEDLVERLNNLDNVINSSLSNSDIKNTLMGCIEV